MSISVVLSTYNSPRWLEKVLWGYEYQSFRDFEVVIADDGSGPETKELIRKKQSEGKLDIRHVWHEDEGFRKCAILNRAILESCGDYLVFSDGDCIPRRDFLAVHAAKRKPGYFLSGGYCKLNDAGSHKISKAHIAKGRAFESNFLSHCGLRGGPFAKHIARGRWADLLNALTPTKKTWNGHNASCWRTDMLSVNGFDERMVYKGEDRELGERLRNQGIRPGQIRYSAVCIHLNHARGYITEEGILLNQSIRRETRQEGRSWTNYGIFKN